VSDDIDAISHQCWAMAERVGMEIAELPDDVRETALAGAEHCLRQAGSELGVAGEQLDSIINLQMKRYGRLSPTVPGVGRRSPRGRRIASAAVYTALALDRFKDFWRG
jgi:hypothetical protein